MAEWGEEDEPDSPKSALAKSLPQLETRHKYVGDQHVEPMENLDRYWSLNERGSVLARALHRRGTTKSRWRRPGRNQARRLFRKPGRTLRRLSHTSRRQGAPGYDPPSARRP